MSRCYAFESGDYCECDDCWAEREAEYWAQRAYEQAQLEAYEEECDTERRLLYILQALEWNGGMTSAELGCGMCEQDRLDLAGKVLYPWMRKGRMEWRLKFNGQ